MSSTPGQLGFFRYDGLRQQEDPLEPLAEPIPWPRFRKTLEKSLCRSKRVKGGRPPFDAILMFNGLGRQALYNLSDEPMEYQIRARLACMRF